MKVDEWINKQGYLVSGKEGGADFLRNLLDTAAGCGCSFNSSIMCTFLRWIFLVRLHFFMTFCISFSVTISAFCTRSEKLFQIMEIKAVLFSELTLPPCKYWKISRRVCFFGLILWAIIFRCVAVLSRFVTREHC